MTTNRPEFYVATLNTGRLDFVALGTSPDEARQAIFKMWEESVMPDSSLYIDTLDELDSHYGMRVFGPLFAGEAAASEAAKSE